MKTGPAFSDYIQTEKLPHRHWLHTSYASHGSARQHIRPFFLLFITVAVFGILFVKLFSLQVLQGSYYRLLSDQNRVRTTIIHAQRGIIFDRNNVPLVFNKPGFRKIEKEKTTFLDYDEALQRIVNGEKGIEIDTLRNYPLAESAAHVLGYIGQITKEDLTDPKYASYQGNEVIGKAGIEQYYEEKLRGVDGKQLAEVNAMGETIRTLGQTDPIPGQNITLTLDSKLQRVVYESIKDVKKATIIVSTPKGEILAMVTKPSFDPNLFTMGKQYKVATDAAYKKVSDVILDSENQPFLNRAIGGVYPPGSTFKIVTAASGLENNVIDQNFEVEDTGVVKVGAFSFANWYFIGYGKTEGSVDVVKALKRSNDIFFYKVADLIGVDRLSETARKFGLGAKTGIDLDGEANGLVPDEAWKKKTIGEQWYLGDNYHYGIGQGYLLTTPLQVNVLTQVVANEGTLYKPHLLKNRELGIKNQGLLSKKNAELIRQGMVESCSPGGVAWPLFEFKVSIACKTGTAQHGGEQTLPHAWITLFAPAYNPQIIVTVLVESSGEGSNVAAPVAKKVLEEWFSRLN